jgi:glycosyltransferase involved in cell wall biosynthesis
VTLLLARLAALRPHRPPSAIRRLQVTGTFESEGWFLAHLRPLALSGFDEVIVVSDVPHTPIEGVRFVCPPIWFSRLFGRAAAKLVWMLVSGTRYRPALYMGYHLFPGAMTALLAGRLLGGGTCYQQTGGAVEILGGGYKAENPLLRRLGCASPSLERLAVTITREFDRVVVRGDSSRRFLAQRGVDRGVEVITGSFGPRTPTALSERPYDLVFVGRLIPEKRPILFVEIVGSMIASYPNVAALMIGDGPEREAVKRLVADRGLRDHITLLGVRNDVMDWLLRSKVLVLTSVAEGLPITVAEAMGCGTPVVVSDVGDLAGLVENGVNGWRVAPDSIESYTERIGEILAEEETWRALSQQAVEASRSLASLGEVAARWQRCLAPWASARPAKPSPS